MNNVISYSDEVLAYFKGDTMAADVWRSKYQMKDHQSRSVEGTPDEMHLRLAKEFAEIEHEYIAKEFLNVQTTENHPDHKTTTIHFRKTELLSEFGQKLFNKRIDQTKEQITEEIFYYFKGFNGIVPQGSIMANLGNKYIFGSLSNCFGIRPPLDSYGGIMKTDEELVQLMKRRGGVGTHLNNIRPYKAVVSNASKSSTGVCSFAERFSNTTREVAQEGRRGALMLLLSVQHPEIFRWITVKEDLTKVTGANISVMFTNKFMEAVEAGKDFVCSFPVDYDFENDHLFTETNEGGTVRYKLLPGMDLPYNELTAFKSVMYDTAYFMRVKARDIWEEFVHAAWKTAEPGAAYIDRIIDYSPDGVYESYMPEICNPCGEQWFHSYDTCRLIALNYFGVVRNPFTSESFIDYERLYELAYMQQRIGDDLVDLEAIYIDRILDKIEKDPETDEIKRTEKELWIKIQELALAGRRTGGGLTALGDMLAAINKSYYSPEVVEKVMKTKMRAELDATIDMAILRGPFIGWNKNLEFHIDEGSTYTFGVMGKNSFFQMLLEEFPEQANKMCNYGRRNVSWSTVAPGGTISLMTQTTSGLECLFQGYYLRRKKINANDEDTRIDFVDDMGDKWQEYPVLHPKFKEWIQINSKELLAIVGEVDFSAIDKGMIAYLFEQSPWFGSQASDISWQERIEINSIIQKYTTNAISCTINLPEDVSEDVVHNIYFEGWKRGLKGVTIYRDKSRTGVLVTEVKSMTVTDEFGYNDAVKRPEVLQADYHFVVANGVEYAVIIGKMNEEPYEVFAFQRPVVRHRIDGVIRKISSGEYRFESLHYNIDNLQLTSPDEKLVTRWASLALRHGTHPKYVIEQIEKSEVYISSFPKAIARILKNYIPDENLQGEECPECHEHSIIREEGCKKCTNCGFSKC